MTNSEFTIASFYHFLDKKKLLGSRCRKCQALYLPPRPICTKCHSNDMELAQMKGRGKLVTFTTIAIGTSRMIHDGYDRNNHYCCGIVELDEGPRVSAQILGVNAQNPAEIKIGTPVIIDYPKRDNKPTILTFRVR